MDYFKDYWYVTHYVDIYYKCDYRKHHISKCVREYVQYESEKYLIIKCDFSREFYTYQNVIVKTIYGNYSDIFTGYRYFAYLYGERSCGIKFTNEY